MAIIFIGTIKPTEKEFRRTPLLVRRNKVADALEWLKLNHIDYTDLDISYDNLNQYPETCPPVVVECKLVENPNEPGSLSVDNTEEGGVESGECPFIVHTLLGSEVEAKSFEEQKAIAMKHLLDGGKVLGIGHAETPQSIYNNPHLYPQIFPWLFPYGLGGLENGYGSVKVSEVQRKQALLMYHDKRFQMEPMFPLVAINHEQIKQSSLGGCLLAKKHNFDSITDRLMKVNKETLQSLLNRLAKGESIQPESEDEKMCYQIIHDLDHVAYRVPGSRTSRKYMRQEIWSLISYKGAPSWFITFAPVDWKHPIALYYADQDMTIYPKLYKKDDSIRLIANNPVASARFFKLMVDLFINHVLGYNSTHAGLFGDTNAYYGTVEQ
ncbi:hypothetical protein DENSPDRAFT_788608, partial [Dentipellis sp. KUC8613]